MSVRLDTLDLSNFDLSNVANMSAMFLHSNIRQLIFPKWRIK